MLLRYRLSFVSILCFFQITLWSQIKVETHDGKPVFEHSTNDFILVSRSTGNKDSLFSKLNLDEEVSFIAEFNSPSLSELGLNHRAINKSLMGLSQIESEHSRFQSDAIALNILLKSISGSPDIVYFKDVFNGAAFRSTRRDAERIRQLPYVKRIQEDQQVQMVDDVSNGVIGADSVWSKFGASGKNVVIGIVDTGIDYNHPAMGGGFGSGFKVIGGYDFIDNDNNPFDENGHGTHVAGIAAGNSSKLKGVAYDAKLMAFRVLNAYGYGYQSTVISGIERAVDPDQNPATNDAVDIMNLSLGGYGNPDDPVSTAIDNATRAGVLCVISAGNSGYYDYYYQNIGSPGCARKALTVGASDNSDKIAYFSSRGPSADIYGIKPDVVAPGLSIYSSYKGGDYRYLSGTSMAAPHVTGAAALLLELNPTWTPEEVKSNLMETSTTINENIWTQGSGRINVLKAAGTKSVVTPASFSFGIADLQPSHWIKQDTMTIRNIGTVTESYQVTLENSPTAGIQFQFTPSNFSLSPGQSQKVIISLNVDNGQVPILRTNIPAYSGAIKVQSNTGDYFLPYAFIYSPTITFALQDSISPTYLYLISQTGNRNYTWYYDFSKTNIVEPDTYAVFAIYYDYEGGRYVRLINMVESVVVAKTALVNLRKSDVTYEVTTSMKSTSGIRLIEDFKVIVFRGDRFSFTWGAATGYRTKISALSSRVSFENEILSYADNDRETYINQFSSLNGVSSNLIFTQGAKDYKSIDFDLNLGEDDVRLIAFDKLKTRAYSIYSSIKIDYPLRRKMYFGSNQKLHHILSKQDFYTENWSKRFSTPYIGVDHDTLKIFDAAEKVIFSTTDDLIAWRLGTFLSLTSPPSVNVFGSRAEFKFPQTYEHPALSDVYGGYVSNDTVFCSVSDAQGVLAESWFLNDYPMQAIAVETQSPQYTLKLTNRQLPLNDFPSMLNIEMTINKNNFDMIPPVIKNLSITQNGFPSVYLDYEKGSQVIFSVTETVNPATLEYKIQGENTWVSVPVQTVGLTCSANLPKLKQGIYDLRIKIADFPLNKFTYNLSSAFRSGTKYTSQPSSMFALLRPKDGTEINIGASPIHFEWETSKDASDVTYEFKLHNSSFDTTIQNIKGTKLKLLFIPNSDSQYVWSVKASNGFQKRSAEKDFIFSTVPEEGIIVYQNSPNPFNPSTRIRYWLPASASDKIVHVDVYNMLGQRVRSLVKEKRNSGINSVIWDGRNHQGFSVSSGIYVYRVRYGRYEKSMKMIFIK